jgi:L-threonylcarbamoyladenylate synthase
LAVCASRLQQLDALIDVPDPEERTTIVGERQPTSWIVPAKAMAPSWITGKHQAVAIRISTHPLVMELCDRLGHALVSTSAN